MSRPGATAARYVQDSVSTASPGRLLVMLYDRLALDLVQAGDALARADRTTAHQRLLHAQRIVTELSTTLDHTAGWSGSVGLASLYAWLGLGAGAGQHPRRPGPAAGVHRGGRATARLLAGRAGRDVRRQPRRAAGRLTMAPPPPIAPAAGPITRTVTEPAAVDLADWTEAWAQALDRLELDVEETERLLAGERAVLGRDPGVPVGRAHRSGTPSGVVAGAGDPGACPPDRDRPAAGVRHGRHATGERSRSPSVTGRASSLTAIRRSPDVVSAIPFVLAGGSPPPPGGRSFGPADRPGGCSDRATNSPSSLQSATGLPKTSGATDRSLSAKDWPPARFPCRRPMERSVFDNVTTTSLTSALDNLALRQRVIADNIANIKTPNYHAQRVEFEDALAATSSSGGDGDVQATVAESLEPTREDGNNVNLDTETMSDIDTGLRYQLALHAMNSQFTVHADGDEDQLMSIFESHRHRRHRPHRLPQVAGRGLGQHRQPQHGQADQPGRLPGPLRHRAAASRAATPARALRRGRRATAARRAASSTTRATRWPTRRATSATRTSTCRSQMAPADHGPARLPGERGRRSTAPRTPTTRPCRSGGRDERRQPDRRAAPPGSRRSPESPASAGHLTDGTSGATGGSGRRSPRPRAGPAQPAAAAVDGRQPVGPGGHRHPDQRARPDDRRRPRPSSRPSSRLRCATRPLTPSTRSWGCRPDAHAAHGDAPPDHAAPSRGFTVGPEGRLGPRGPRPDPRRARLHALGVGAELHAAVHQPGARSDARPSSTSSTPTA